MNWQMYSLEYFYNAVRVYSDCEIPEKLLCRASTYIHAVCRTYGGATEPELPMHAFTELQ